MASIAQFIVVILLHLCIVSSLQFDPLRLSEEEHDYLRFADVRRHCQSVLSSATELPYNTNRPNNMKNQLSFEKGDWSQDAGKAPLVPFDGGEVVKKDAQRLPDPLSLTTFVLTHVEGDSEDRARAAAVNVSGVLVLTIARKNAGLDLGPHISVVSPGLNLSAGSTRLQIIFEGVYTETAEGSNGDDAGERVLCMVGRAVLPKRSTHGVDPWDWAKNSGRRSFQPPVTADNNILLVLRYPKKLSLTTRAVFGKMESTSSVSADSYFDTVQLMSALMSCCPYHFRPEELAAGVGDALSAGGADNVVSNRARDAYKPTYPCEALNRHAFSGQDITVLPGWHCNSTAGASCHGIGPFEMDRAEDADVLAGVRIIMQDLQCMEQQGYGMGSAAGTAMVSVVFRALSPWEDTGTAMSLSGLSGKTLSAEGVWNASTGQACMMACRGTVGRKACDFRVCLFFLTTMSITRLDTMLGQINAVDAGGGVVHPPLLSFRQRMSTPRLWGFNPDAVPYKYNYTKVDLAVELRQRSGSPFDLRKIVPHSLPLSYPKGSPSSFSLAHMLTLFFLTVPGMFRQDWSEQPVLHLEVFFVGQLINPYTPSDASSGIQRNETGLQGHPLLLNVSAELKLFQGSRPRNPVMSLEGVYSPDDGRMHLIGCRDVRLPRRNSSATASSSRDLQLEEGSSATASSSRDLQLEEGMDCSIEVKIEYPPTTMHRFIMSKAKVQIASTRTAADSLHFDALKLRALPVNYPQQQPGGFYRGVVNGVLCILLLSATIAALLTQLRYLKSHADVAPYISLVMLGVQALGYGMPLVTGVEAILARVTLGDGATAPSSGRTPYYMFDWGRLCESIDQAVKILSLCALVLTLRLGQKVRRSREHLAARSPLDLARVPSDGKVFVYHCGFHLVLFVLILALNRGGVTVEQQVALMQDLFLLPQVIGNAMWHINCRPLKGSFFVGVTAVRLLPHVYDYVRPSAAFAGAHYSGMQDFMDAASASGGRFFVKAGDVVIPLPAVALALVLHAQQRWNYAIVSRMGSPEQKKLQHIF